MKIVDTNVLIYAITEDAPQHRAAKGWLDDALASAEPVGFAWIVITGFLRITTSTRVFPNPLPPADAFAVVEQWLGRPGAVIVTPGIGHLRILRDLTEHTGTGGNLVSDAHIAALAIEHRATVITFDNDFSRFTAVRWEQPTPP